MTIDEQQISRALTIVGGLLLAVGVIPLLAGAGAEFPSVELSLIVVITGGTIAGSGALIWFLNDGT